MRGTAQNPDVYFQARETVNPFYAVVPAVVQEVMDEVAAHTGRHYRVAEYTGHPEADRVVVVMGSGGETVRETVTHLVGGGERVGVLQLRLYRPFPAAELLAALPGERDARWPCSTAPRSPAPTASRSTSTSWPPWPRPTSAATGPPSRGSSAAATACRPRSSPRRWSPASSPSSRAQHRSRRFTIGITDDVGGTSLPYDDTLDIEEPDTLRAVFYGLGSDGTVGANKNTIKILGADPDVHAQAYFVYDSKKSGGLTVSHLRFGPHPIHAPYLVNRAGFVGCHHLGLLDTVDVLACAEDGATLLLNAPQPAGRGVGRPARPGAAAGHRQAAAPVSPSTPPPWPATAGLPGRTNTVLQTCFFAISGVLPADEAVAARQGGDPQDLQPSRVGGGAPQRGRRRRHPRRAARGAGAGAPARRRARCPTSCPSDAPEFVRTVTAAMMAGRGDDLPVSAMPVDGTFPSGTTAYEKRRISDVVAAWDPDACIQCGTCSFVCPHSVIRSKFYAGDALDDAPEGFRSAPLNAAGLPGSRYTLQVYVEDCTGCGLCVEACPVSPRR